MQIVLNISDKQIKNAIGRGFSEDYVDVRLHFKNSKLVRVSIQSREEPYYANLKFQRR